MTDKINFLSSGAEDIVRKCSVQRQTRQDFNCNGEMAINKGNAEACLIYLVRVTSLDIMLSVMCHHLLTRQNKNTVQWSEEPSSPQLLR